MTHQLQRGQPSTGRRFKWGRLYCWPFCCRSRIRSCTLRSIVSLLTGSPLLASLASSYRWTDHEFRGTRAVPTGRPPAISTGVSAPVFCWPDQSFTAKLAESRPAFRHRHIGKTSRLLDCVRRKAPWYHDAGATTLRRHPNLWRGTPTRWMPSPSSRTVIGCFLAAQISPPSFGIPHRRPLHGLNPFAGNRRIQVVNLAVWWELLEDCCGRKFR